MFCQWVFSWPCGRDEDLSPEVMVGGGRGSRKHCYSNKKSSQSLSI